LAKKGFTNIFAKDFSYVNLEKFQDIEANTVVTEEWLKAQGLVSRIGKDGVKVLGRGDVTVALHVRVSKLTKSAVEKIQSAGGTTEGPVPK